MKSNSNDKHTTNNQQFNKNEVEKIKKGFVMRRLICLKYYQEK